MSMPSTVPVTIRLDGRTFWTLSKIAERQHTTVDAILSGIATKLTQPKERKAARTRTTQTAMDRQAQVTRMLADGLSPIAISNELNISPQRVYQLRAAIVKAKNL